MLSQRVRTDALLLHPGQHYDACAAYMRRCPLAKSRVVTDCAVPSLLLLVTETLTNNHAVSSDIGIDEFLQYGDRCAFPFRAISESMIFLL